MIQIREAAKRDSESIFNLIKNDPYITWSKESIQNEINSNFFILSTINDELTGALSSIIISNTEAQITLIHIKEAYRRLKIGTLLFSKLLDECIKKNVKSINLEVGKDNNAALDFYKNNGFEIIGRRAHYYSNTEDALVLNKIINT